MKFECINNQFIELSVIGYQFSKITDEWNSNWLLVHINVKSNEKHWNKTDPAITTFELKWLIDWFKNISENKIEKYKRMDFTEPNISFELLNDFESNIKQIKINFMAEFNPISDVGTEYSIELNATNKQLKKYAEDLEIELNKYPERVKFKKPQMLIE
ncbi:MAG: hypothetical protein LBK73_11640 [Treponema sp.]|jgi:hypothetical protein|nr:hypothetical protein [Treponema sp.]